MTFEERERPAQGTARRAETAPRGRRRRRAAAGRPRPAGWWRGPACYRGSARRTASRRPRKTRRREGGEVSGPQRRRTRRILAIQYRQPQQPGKMQPEDDDDRARKLESHASTSVAASCKTAPSTTPRAAKTAEKPITNRMVPSKTSLRWRSEWSREVPTSWARKAGITGSMHGERKEARPAKAARTSVGSATFILPGPLFRAGAHRKKRSFRFAVDSHTGIRGRQSVRRIVRKS